MAHDSPDLDTFRQKAAAHPAALIPVYRRIFSDALTPVLAYRRLVRPDDRMAPSFLLESVVGGDRVGRYSYLGAQPAVQVIAHGNQVKVIDTINPDRSRTYTSQNPLDEIAHLSAQIQALETDGLPDFCGGWVGFAGYDTVRYLEGEKLTAPPPDDRHLPDVHMGLYRRVVAFDHVQKTVVLVTHMVADEHPLIDAAYESAQRDLDELARRITQDSSPDQGGTELAVGQIDLNSPPPNLPTSNMGDGGYQQAVIKAKEYIAAGDIFQVVPSQRFELRTEADPFDIYRALRVVNPSPYMFYLQIDGGMLVGSSPEILCRVQDGVVTNRPLAGTRQRGSDEQEDQRLEAQLLADPKERAEHIMLVDLGRNDVGRVATPGSIALPALMTIERYSHVMHISSTVTAQLAEERTCWDALRYTLPVGTVSGAPKVRAMQIIDELEPTRRGPYAGAVGYVDLAGNMDMAIALRTMVITPAPGNALGSTPDHVQRDGIALSERAATVRERSVDLGRPWTVHIQAGGGIVADSDPEAEHQETLNKAAAMAKAVDLAQRAFSHPS